MTDAFINSCKAALKNMIACERVLEAENPYTAFSEGILNFHAHYCADDHSSSWCWHEKVYNTITMRFPYSYGCMYVCMYVRSQYRRRMAGHTM